MLLGLAAIVIIVAGLRAASSLFVPFLLAGFISLLCTPALFWMKDRGLPTPIALIVVLLGLFGIGAVFGISLLTAVIGSDASAETYRDAYLVGAGFAALGAVTSCLLRRVDHDAEPEAAGGAKQPPESETQQSEMASAQS